MEQEKSRIKIAICDDEPAQIDRLRKLLERIRPEYEITTYREGPALLEKPVEAEVVFLDIEMPKLSGVETARRLREQGYRGEIIFLTGYPEFMQEAFEVRTYRYLIKPAKEEEVLKVFEDLEREWSRSRRLFLNEFGLDIVVDVRDIRYVISKGHNTEVRLYDRSFDSTKTLKEWEKVLGKEEFFQIHKSYLVSLAHIASLQANAITMADTGEQLPVARRRYHPLREVLADYVRKYAHTI